MIQEDTIFIIGAGASFPYGFPLGLDVRKKIWLESPNLFNQFFVQTHSPVKSLLYERAEKFR